MSRQNEDYVLTKMNIVRWRTCTSLITLHLTRVALSRPAKLIKKQCKDQTRKPQGRKAIRPSKATKYHNWFTPFLFKQIDDTRRRSGGPRWSTTAIVKDLKQRDITSFARLNWTTVDGWIDQSGEKPIWSDTTLERIRQGNNVTNPNAGRKGVLVHITVLIIYSVKMLTSY
jgi:hypothetical protein